MRISLLAIVAATAAAVGTTPLRAQSAEEIILADPAFSLTFAAGYIASAGLPAASLLALGAGLLELVAGIALIVGFKARWAALALGIFTLLASVLFHAYWAAPAEQAYVQQLMFMKNLAVAGGMFLVAALGAGPFSIDARRVAA